MRLIDFTTLSNDENPLIGSGGGGGEKPDMKMMQYMVKIFGGS